MTQTQEIVVQVDANGVVCHDESATNVALRQPAAERWEDSGPGLYSRQYRTIVVPIPGTDAFLEVRIEWGEYPYPVEDPMSDDGSQYDAIIRMVQVHTIVCDPKNSLRMAP